ncbi:MAG: T9SS type A sorting domain-containing protein [Bacteroidota bacterium]
MNKVYCLIGMFITCGVCSGQNLVINPGFEDTISCPSGQGALWALSSWFNPNGASPDYFNQCSNPNIAGVPDNFYGYQFANAGVGYSGIVLAGLPNFREYIEDTLTFPLVANQCYQFNMYISLGDECQYTSDDIGVYFSGAAITGVISTSPLPVIPQINFTLGLTTDTVNWIPLSGIYTAQGGERYIIIGNFKNDALSTTFLFNPTGQRVYCLFYIDDVSLSACTEIKEQDDIAEISIFPNPFSDKINITVKRNELVEVNLYDVTARKIFNKSFTNSTSINTEQLAKGIYLYEVRNKNGVIKKGKIVKE